MAARVVGPLEGIVWRCGWEEKRQRVLLAPLLVNANELVAVDHQLVQRLFGERRREGAVN